MAMAFAGCAATQLAAQGTTTGAITGVVTGEQGQMLEAAQVQVVNTTTGFTTGGVTRANGLFLVQGLEVGGPYTVTVRRIGFSPGERTNVYVSLGQATRVDMRLATRAVELSGVTVVGSTTSEDFSPTRQGVSTTVTDSLISRLPALGRDFTDMVKLAPQVAQPTADGPSAGGVYNRLNNFTIDGANQNDRFNLGSSEGSPGSASGGRLISIDAVKEFQVLMSPTDVRQGNFGGMLVNAVTKAGTNEWHGGIGYTRRSPRLDFLGLNPKLAAGEPFIQNGDLQVRNYSFQLSGPIIRDRLHFFIAPEWQDRSAPSSGPFLNQTSGNQGVISPDSIERIRQALSGDFDVGDGGIIRNENPTRNIFARIDYQLNNSSRIVLRQLWNTAENDAFSRNTFGFNPSVFVQNSGFRLTSNAFTGENTNNSTAAQLFTNFANGASNEFLVGYNTIRDVRIVPVAAPEISVGVRTLTGAAGVVTVGTEQFSPGNDLKQKIIEISNNYSLPVGAHTVTIGGRFENTDIYNNFAQRSFGVYRFANIDQLVARTPINYSLGYDNGGGIAAEFATQQYSVYAQDQWAWSRNFTLSFGLRADIPRILDKPAFNDSLAARFQGISTSDVPKTRVLFSPRIGFNWDTRGDQTFQLRGNAGIFTGPPPFIMIGNSFANTGLGLVTLICSTQALTPAFTTDVNALPRACRGRTEPAPGAAGTAGLNVTDPDFKYPQNFTGTLGFDTRLPYDFIFTAEGLYRKAINGLMVHDINLRGPRIVNGVPYRDKDGRILYADTISSAGAVSNFGQLVVDSLRGVPLGEGIIQVSNQNADYNYTLTGQLKRRFGFGLDVTGAYTYMQSKDVMSLTSDRAISNWRFGRSNAGLESDETATTSYFERPHRVLLVGAYTFPWRTTGLSLYYEGMSGTPFTYTAVGDLNGDGTNVNDPIYVPRNAVDPTEIRIGSGSGGAFVLNPTEAQAFQDFIDGQECLKDQRGKIMERNSCRSPWQNRMDVSFSQSLPQYRGHRLSVKLDIINFLNLINKDWGQIELPTLSANFPQQAVLRQQGRTPGPLSLSQPNLTFESLAKTEGPFFKSQTVSSNFYQMQLSVRYQF